MLQRRLLPFVRLPHRLAAVLLLGLLLSGAAQAQAERAERDLPLLIEADALRYDDVRQISVFTGNVVATRGSLVLRGERIEVRQDEQANQFGSASGSPAFFRQQREGIDEFIEGQAQRIDYDSTTETVRLVGNAVMRRYRGAQLHDETSGNVITYDRNSGMFTVEGGLAHRTPANPAGRVRAMITPTPRVAPAPPVGAPAPLRPSGQIGEGRR